MRKYKLVKVKTIYLLTKLMAGHRILAKVLFVWAYQILLLDLGSQVHWCCAHVNLPEDGGVGDSYYIIDPYGGSDIKKINKNNQDQTNERDSTMEYNVNNANGGYVSNEDKLFKRGVTERRNRAKLRRMMKHNGLLHKGRLHGKNISTLEENISAIEQSKNPIKDSPYSYGDKMFGKENSNNKYEKPSLVMDDKEREMSGNSPTNEVFEVSNISNVKDDDETSTSERKDHVDTNIHLMINHPDKDTTSHSSNTTPRGLKTNAAASKYKKRPLEKMRTHKEKNRNIKLKNGIILPIKKLLKKKMKNKIHAVTEKSKYENTYEDKEDESLTNDAQRTNYNINIESRKIPAEGLYGLEDNISNLSQINHGFLKAFEKRYFDNHFNETENNIISEHPLSSLENYTAYGYNLKRRPKPNDWKAWDGFNVGDYYEPLLYLKDKETLDSKTLIDNHQSQSKNPAYEPPNNLVEYSKHNNIESQNLIQQPEQDKLGISKTKKGKSLYDKKKRYMISSKSKHKVHAKNIEHKNRRGARDTRMRSDETNVFPSNIFNDNDNFDDDENNADNDEIYSDVERPKLVFQIPEQEENYRYRSKKDDGYLKKPHSHKLKSKMEESNGFRVENQFRALHSGKAFESNYNGDERESTESCIGYKSEDVINTTEITTVNMTEPTVTTKRINNGKTKIFGKSKKLNVEMKNNTNHTDEIDERGLFLCGQLPDDFVKAVFTKVRKSKKILKELGFSNETDQSCDRCIETKAIKLPDLEIMRSTLGKCDLRHKNTKCNAVPEPMENFLLMLLSLGKDDEDCVSSRLRNDNSFIFSGDDMETLTKIENGADTNGKYNDDRDIFNKATFEKQHIIREEIDEENIENKGSKGHQTISEEGIHGLTPKDVQGVAYELINEESDVRLKAKPIIQPKGPKHDSGERQIIQSEENLKGNELIDVFEGLDSLSTVHHKYPLQKELNNRDENQNTKNMNNKITPKRVDYNNEDIINSGSGSLEGKKLDYLNEPREGTYLQDKNHKQCKVIGPKEQHYQGYDVESVSNGLHQRQDGNPLDIRDRYPEHFGRYVKTYNSPSRFIKSKDVTHNKNKYPIDRSSYSANDNSMGDMEYQLYPGQKLAGNDVSYNALPFYDGSQRMGKRETPLDTNEEDIIFFELPNIEYDLY